MKNFLRFIALAPALACILFGSVAFADAPFLTFSNPTLTGAGLNGNGTHEYVYTFDSGGSNISGDSSGFVAAGGNFAISLSLSPGTYTVVVINTDGNTNPSPYCGAGTTLTGCQNDWGYSPDSNTAASVHFTISAAGSAVPTVASSDIAMVGGAMLTGIIGPSEYVLRTFGPPLFVFLLVIAVFFAIYHRAKVGHWL